MADYIRLPMFAEAFWLTPWCFACLPPCCTRMRPYLSFLLFKIWMLMCNLPMTIGTSLHCSQFFGLCINLSSLPYSSDASMVSMWIRPRRMKTWLTGWEGEKPPFSQNSSQDRCSSGTVTMGCNLNNCTKYHKHGCKCTAWDSFVLATPRCLVFYVWFCMGFMFLAARSSRKNVSP